MSLSATGSACCIPAELSMDDSKAARVARGGKPSSAAPPRRASPRHSPRPRAGIIANLWAIIAAYLVVSFSLSEIRAAEEPPALNPFGKVGVEREDQFPGYIEMADGSIHCGMIYLTRDKRLQINDEKKQRQREIPLNVVQQIECKVKREWMEKEWKFKELAKDEKMYTGRSYPAREYDYVVTLQDGRTIEGGLSGVVYLQPQIYDPQRPNEYRPAVEAQKFLLHKRDKGEIGDELKSLNYVKLIKLGDEAYREGQQKSKNRRTPAKSAR